MVRSRKDKKGWHECHRSLFGKNRGAERQCSDDDSSTIVEVVGDQDEQDAEQILASADPSYETWNCSGSSEDESCDQSRPVTGPSSDECDNQIRACHRHHSVEQACNSDGSHSHVLDETEVDLAR